MLPENRDFWVRGDDDQEYGPVGLEELREWVQENRAGLGTSVRRDEPNAAWYPWQHYPELVALLAEARVTSPVPGLPGMAIASLGKRMLACVLDLILCSILATPMLYVVMATIKVPNWEEQFMAALTNPQSPPSPELLHYIMISNLLTYVVLLAYMAGFHAAHGQTPAKALLRLRVVDENGQKPSLAKTFIRGVAFVLSFYLYGIPFLYAFFNPQRRTFHDFIAGTYVVEA